MIASDIIRRALRLASAIDADEAVDAASAQDALDTLNALLAEWRGSGILVPDYDVASVDTTLTLALADREAVAYQLALRIVPEFGKTISQEFAKAMDESFSRLRLRYFQPGKVCFGELPTSSAYTFNIATGE
jgi:hypothetical protein